VGGWVVRVFEVELVVRPLKVGGAGWLQGIARYDNINDIYFLCLAIAISPAISLFLSMPFMRSFAFPGFPISPKNPPPPISLSLSLSKVFDCFCVALSFCSFRLGSFSTFCYLKYFKDFSIFYLNTLFREMRLCVCVSVSEWVGGWEMKRHDFFSFVGPTFN